MATLGVEEIAGLIEEYYPGADDELLQKLSAYLDLLAKWNTRTNLTAIREPREMVRRHFGESLFLARHVPTEAGNLLDYGSGAGFPGIPVQLVRPSVQVTLAESQNKKVAFLREVVRTLGLSTEVWGGRVEVMAVDRKFDVVVLRAVDKPEDAMRGALARVATGGLVLSLEGGEVDGHGAAGQEGVIWVPSGTRRYLRMTKP